MTDVFIELGTIESLDRFLAQSNVYPVIIFKHSDDCGISVRAHADLAKLERPVGIITVQKAHEVSDEVEKRTGVAHETPQVLIIRNGTVVWNASHGQVKAESVEVALEEVGRRQ